MSNVNEHAADQTGSDRRDFVVIGGGVVGAFTAYELARRGYQVAIVDRDRIGSGASSGNCGYICPSHVFPLCGPGAIQQSLPALLSRKGALSIPMRLDPTLWNWLTRFALHCRREPFENAASARHALLQHSDRLYRRWLAETSVDCQWTQAGLLMVHRTHKTLDHYASLAHRLTGEFGIRCDRLDTEQMLALEPTLVDTLAGGWWFPDDSHVHPGQMMQSLRDQLIQLGVTLIEGTEVLKWHVRGDSVTELETTAGKITGDQYVLSTGAEAPILSRMLGSKIPIVPGKGYSMEFLIDDQPVTTPMIFEDSHVAVTPYADRLRVGSTMQLTGYDRRIDPSRLNMIRNEAQTYLRTSLPEKSINDWAGWRPMMADDLPVIDKAASLGNAWIAAGNGMIGLSTGPATGQLIAQLICGEATDIPAQPFSLSRFGWPRRGKSNPALPSTPASTPATTPATAATTHGTPFESPSAPELNRT